MDFTITSYFLSFLEPTRCARLIIEFEISTPDSFTNFLTFSRTFSYRMLAILRQVLWKFVHVCASSVLVITFYRMFNVATFFGSDILLTISLLRRKVTIEESLSTSFRTSLIAFLISS